MERGVYQHFYDLETTHWWFTGMRAICSSMLATCGANVGGRLLDVGCGTGMWLTGVGDRVESYGCDVSLEALRFCRSRRIHHLTQASGEHLPYASDSFAVVTALGVIEHVDDDHQMLAEMYRVCAPGGVMLILTSAYPFLWSYHDDVVHHKRRYWAGELRQRMAARGFEVVRVSYVNSLLFLPILAVRVIQRITGWAPNGRDETPDVFGMPGPINRILSGVLSVEGRMLKFVDFPFGVGLLGLGRKPK